MIDICTVVFEPELLYLKAQARSVELYCANIGIRSIRVMINDRADLADQVDPAWWGSLQHLVTVIPRDSFDVVFPDHGWLGQQTLKLLGAGGSANTWCMALDAKTIFVNPFMLSEIMDSEHRPCVGHMPIQPVFEPSRSLVSALFGIDLQRQLGPMGVPFLFHSQSVRDMIDDVERRVQQPFSDWFHSQGMITEFILYSGFLESQGQLDHVYNTTVNNIKCCNLCHGEVSIFQDKFLVMPGSHTVSVHRGAWSQLQPEQQQQYRTLLHQRGIDVVW